MNFCSTVKYLESHVHTEARLGPVKDRLSKSAFLRRGLNFHATRPAERGGGGGGGGVGAASELCLLYRIKYLNLLSCRGL